MSDSHPLTAEQVEAVWLRFLAAVQCGPVELDLLRRVEIDKRGATIWAYLIGERAGDFAFASCHEAEAFSLGRLYAPRETRRATLARPGSREKIEVLAARVDSGESLWHPDDQTPSPLERLLAHA